MTKPNSSLPINKSEIVSIFVIICILILWGVDQSQSSVNANIAYLINAAQRMLEGMKMSEGYFDTNPPLSMIIYIPTVWIKDIFGIPFYHTPFIYTCIVVLLSTLVTAKLLYTLNWTPRAHNITIIAAYIFANTLLLSGNFGEKENLMIMAITPFVLLQFCITENIKINKKLALSVLIFGSIAFLVKPHFGLIPAAILSHRLITQKKIKTIIDPDTIALCAMTMLYLISIRLFFYDFITVILPEILRIYTTTNMWAACLTVGGPMIMLNLIGLIINYLQEIKTPTTKFSNWFFILSLLATTAFFAQGKGFYYHIIPAWILAVIAVTVLICSLLDQYAPDKTLIKTMKNPILILITAITLFTTRHDAETYSHEQYLNTEFVQQIKNTPCARPPCSFYMFSPRMPLPNEISTYSGFYQASRFPSLWFIGKLIDDVYYKNKKTDEIEDFEKYSNILLEDFERFDPKIIFLSKLDLTPFDIDAHFDVKEFFYNHNPKWPEFWNNYTKVKTIGFDYKAATGYKTLKEDKVLFDVYIKNNNMSLK